MLQCNEYSEPLQRECHVLAHNEVLTLIFLSQDVFDKKKKKT